MKLTKKLLTMVAVLSVSMVYSSQVKSEDDKNRTTTVSNYEVKNMIELDKVGDGFTACSWTNNQNIILTKKGFTGLYLYDKTSHTKKTISEAMSVGYQYQQIDGGNQLLTKYATFNKKEAQRKEGVKVFNLKTLQTEFEQIFDQSRISIPAVSIQKNTAIKVNVKNKMEGVEVKSLSKASNKKTEIGFWNKYPLVYTDEGLRLYKEDEVIKISDMYGIDAVVSPNGKLMCFNDNGILKIRDENQKERTIGEGLNASWLPNSAALIYQITEDDGQQITNSEIYVYDLSLSKVFQLTNTPEIFEEYPSVSKDSKKLLCTDIDTGVLYIGDFVTQ